jgi:cell fate regulator YaaT (PSP1 superfamily)
VGAWIFNRAEKKSPSFLPPKTRIQFPRIGLKQLAAEFSCPDRMRQIGARNEAKMMGGVGCVRIALFAVFLSFRIFEPVTIRNGERSGAFP